MSAELRTLRGFGRPDQEEVELLREVELVAIRVVGRENGQMESATTCGEIDEVQLGRSQLERVIRCHEDRLAASPPAIVSDRR